MTVDPVAALKARNQEEPYRRLMDIEVVEIEPGRALTAMVFDTKHQNIFNMLHGGALFSLMDEAFQLACNAFGETSVALQMSINFLAPAEPGQRILAEVKQVHATNKTDLYECLAWQESDGKHLARCSALAYRTRRPHPWLDSEN